MKPCIMYVESKAEGLNGRLYSGRVAVEIDEDVREEYGPRFAHARCAGTSLRPENVRSTRAGAALVSALGQAARNRA